MKTIEELDNEIKELRCVIAVLQIKIDGILKHEPENCECADVDKAFEEWFADPKQTAFYRISPTGEHWFAKQSVKNFALYYAQRCGVVLDGNSEIQNNHKCDHPYHSVVGGNGSPERCLTCRKVLSI